MTEWDFTITLDGPELDDDALDRLYEVGLDATYSYVDGVGYLDVTRQADRFVKAIVPSITQLDRAGFTIRHIDWGELVSQADIARRLDVARETVRLWALGERGPGGFPPAAAGDRRNRLYRWVDVACWAEPAGVLADNATEARDELERGWVTDAVNARLRARFALTHLEETEAEEVRQLADR